MPKKKITNTAQTQQIWEAVRINDPELLEGIETDSLLDLPARKMPHPTPLLAASLQGKQDVMNALMLKGCSLFSLDDWKRSPLEVFAWSQQWDWFELNSNYLKEHVSGTERAAANISLSGVMRATLATQDEVKWVEWARQLGGLLDKSPEYKELPDVLMVSEEEWATYKKDHAQEPEMFSRTYDDTWLGTHGEYFPWAMGRGPMELYVLGASGVKAAWCAEHGVNTDAAKVPEDYRMLYLRIAIDAKRLMPVPFESMLALVESLDLLKTNEDKCWMWLELFNRAAEMGRPDWMERMNAHVVEKYNVSLVRSVWPSLDQPRGSPNLPFKPQPTWRDFHASGKIIFFAGNDEMLSTGTHPTNRVDEKDRAAMAARAKQRCDILEKMFELGLSPQFTERGWGYSLLHQAAATGAGAVVDLLCESDEVNLLQKSGKQQRGKTAREIAQTKGHARIVAFLEAAELKRKHAHITRQNAGPKFGDVL